jgi:hypothetical protein
MTKEVLRPWLVDARVAGRIAVSGLRDEDDGLTILITDESGTFPRATIVFGEVVAYRNINESYRLRTWSENDMASLPSLVTVDNSRWVRWLCDESQGTLAPDALVHYAVYTADDCIDVVSRGVPIVR